jgi:hypothetical protein
MTTPKKPLVLVRAIAAQLSLAQLEDAARSLELVAPEMAALDAGELAPMNTNVVAASSIVLRVVPGIVEHRDEMVMLPGFEPRFVDSLPDYAKAARLAFVGSRAGAAAYDGATLAGEVIRLRTKLLVWAIALEHEGIFESGAVETIREGRRDPATDLVALLTLFGDDKGVATRRTCVTSEDLAHGAQVASAAFAMRSQRALDRAAQGALEDGPLRARRAWTLLDRAYGQCRRALAYLRFEEDDADLIAPNLRRNRGHGRKPAAVLSLASAPRSDRDPKAGEG